MTEANVQKLVEFISQKRTYEEVEQAAFMIDDKWRSETWRRSLRRRKDIKAIGKNGSAPDGYNPIAFYEPDKYPYFNICRETIDVVRENGKMKIVAKEPEQNQLFKLSPRTY